MRHLTLFFLFLLFPLFSFAQTGSWASLGLGLDGPVYAIAMDDDYLYAGGEFSTAITGFGNFTEDANFIARWNGSEWSALGLGLDGSVQALAIDEEEGYLYVGGSFSKAYNGNGTFLATNNIARWNLNTWKWETVGEGLNNSCSALLFKNGVLYVGGVFTQAGNQNANYIASWNGQNWQTLSLGLNGECSALAMNNSGQLLVGGTFTLAGGIDAKSIAVWNGTSWSALGGGVSNPGYVNTVGVDGEQNVYVGGWMYLADDEVEIRNIAKWTGTTWQSLGNGLNDVVYSSTTDSYGNIYLGGAFTELYNSGGVSMPYIAYWNGNWNTLSANLNDACLALFTAPNGEIFAGGNFTTAGNFEAHYIAKWTPETVSTSAISSDNFHFQIYPQPARDQLHIVLHEAFAKSNTPLQISLYSLEGRLLQSLRVSPGETQHTLSVQHLPKGPYLLRLQNGEQQITRLISVQ